MSKKTMLLALSVISAAFFVLPALASATPAHIDATEAFNVKETNRVVLQTEGQRIECHGGMSGSGSFESTTTGTLTLAYHGCTVAVIGQHVSCTTHSQPSGTITTESLSFHLINIANHSPGVLVTPNNGVFAHLTCGFVNTLTGNGLIGTISALTCGTAGTTATLKFEQGPNLGIQKHTTHTGVNYHTMSGESKAALIAEGTIQFGAGRTLVCTL